MLTVHAAPLVLPVGAAAVHDGAVAVDGDRIAAIGAYDAVVEAFPLARVRRWPGVITPGLRQRHAGPLLISVYHPDPREAPELGTEPIGGSALEALEIDETRWAGSVRRGIARMLAHGTTAVAGDFPAPVRTVVSRSGLTVVPAPPADRIPAGGPGLDPFVAGADLAGTVNGPLEAGGRADLAAFDAPDEAALVARGAGCCVATVVGGRLVHRAR